MARVVIVGAGLAGLSCAVRLIAAGVDVLVLEAARHAGGRCRSFYDKSLATTIDNGNHLLLSGNSAAMDLLDAIGARDGLIGPDTVCFPFADLATGERWTVSPSHGRIPWWVFDASRRVAGTTPADYFSIVRLLKRHAGTTFTDIIAPRGALYERFWDPFIVAVLNAAPEQAAAELLTPVLWETFAKGAGACRPLVAREGLSDTFVEPALAHITRAGSEVRFGARVADIHYEGNRATFLRCGAEQVDIDPEDMLVLAVTAPVAQDLVPDLTVPMEHSAIVNLHYRLDPPPRLDGPFIGLVNGLAQWLFVRDDIASVTISAADDVAERPSEEIANQVWREISPVLGRTEAEMPPCRVIKEKRATFLQSPSQVALRPGTETQIANLLLAGDWTDTGLPATIEGTIRSGNAAADVALARLGHR